MILSRPEIKRQLESGRLAIVPAPSDARIGAASINLRLGRKFARFKEGGLPDHIPAIRIRPSIFGSVDLWTHEEDADTCNIEPRGFVLEFDGVEHDMGGAVPKGVLESIHDLCPQSLIERRSFETAGRAM